MRMKIAPFASGYAEFLGSVLDLLLPFLKYLVWLEVNLSNHKSATLPIMEVKQINRSAEFTAKP